MLLSLIFFFTLMDCTLQIIAIFLICILKAYVRINLKEKQWVCKNKCDWYESSEHKNPNLQRKWKWGSWKFFSAAIDYGFECWETLGFGSKAWNEWNKTRRRDKGRGREEEGLVLWVMRKNGTVWTDEVSGEGTAEEEEEGKGNDGSEAHGSGHNGSAVHHL